jgi:nucleoside-diphosphate-sugar epimerase
VRVLVTGGSGFIGSVVTAELAKAGHDVTVLDRAGTRETTDIDARFVFGDTQDTAAVFSAMESQDCVAHLAAGSSFLMYESNPIEETTGAVSGFHNVLEAAIRVGVQRLVYASTSAVYEGNTLPYHERMALNPPDLKALAKKFNEELAELYERRYGIQTIGVRPFSVYGAGETVKGPYANVASLFAWAMSAGHRPLLWGSGEQTRDLIYVDDVARAIVVALESSTTGVINIGTGSETSFLDLIALLNSELGTMLEPESVDVPIKVYARRLLGDPALAERQLGFVAQVTVSEGIRRILESVQSLPARERAELANMQTRFRFGIRPSYST